MHAFTNEPLYARARNSRLIDARDASLKTRLNVSQHLSANQLFRGGDVATMFDVLFEIYLVYVGIRRERKQ